MKKSPMKRLDFYSVSHVLRHRLERYQATTPAVSIFRGQSFPSLRIWALLLDEDDDALLREIGLDPDERIPTPEEWFGRVEA